MRRKALVDPDPGHGQIGLPRDSELVDLAFSVSGPDTVPTPEPSTLVGAGIGVAMMLGYAWRKRRRAAA